jgi:FkbH-like protein
MNSQLTAAPINLPEYGSDIKSAQSLYKDGYVAEAENLFRQILTESPDSLAAVRGLVQILNQREDYASGQELYRRFAAEYPAHNNVLACAQQWESWEKFATGPKSVRIAVVGSGTLTSLSAYIRVAIASAGLQPVVYTGEFGQWAQDLLAPASQLHSFSPDVIILAIDTQSLFAAAATKFAPTAEEISAELASGVRHISELLAAAEKHSPSATVILHSMAVPDYSPLGILDIGAPGGQRERIQSINSALTSVVRDRFKKVIMLDLERIEARHGKANVRDERMWYMASIPYAPTFMAVLSREYKRIAVAIKGLTKKCIVLDLDNTLWGGVVGEDGYDGIKLGGTSAPGNSFTDFQKALDNLRQRGILLALCSKNNPDDVWPVLDTHPGMVLKREHFAAVRINWQDKATNIVEIARELNIGLDSLVFLDDNPAERGLVRQQVPQVVTVEMPKDPAYYLKTLLDLDLFETIALTEEDLRRSALYQEEQARKQFESAASETGDLKDYLRGLDIKVKIDTANSFTIPRIAQLINKTNQFNVTTRRYTEAEVRSMAENPDDWGVYSINVSDRFGDSGLTGVTLVKKLSDHWQIDAFLMSCRVLGRGIEDALLYRVITDARESGAQHLIGEFIPTDKNAPSADFFANQGFTKIEDRGTAVDWKLDLNGLNRTMPDWLNAQ